MEESIAVILNYGPELLPHIVEHLENAIAFCNEKKPRAIFLTGACTRGRTMPGVSEAAAAYRYIKPRLIYEPKFILDETAWTTIDNVRNLAAALMRQEYYDLRGDAIVVFCEASRALAIDILCRELIGTVPVLKTGSWPMGSPKIQALATIYAWAATKLPFLAYFLRVVRRRKLSDM